MTVAHRHARTSPTPAAELSAASSRCSSSLLLVVWTGVPLFMAVMWSLVNPDDPWSPPAVLPPSLSLAQWEYVFTFSEIVQAVSTSFILAPIVTVVSFVLALPTAYALGRFSFPRQGSAAHPDPAADRHAGDGHRDVPEPRLLCLRPGADVRWSGDRPHAAQHALHAAHPRHRLRIHPAGRDRRRAQSRRRPARAGAACARADGHAGSASPARYLPSSPASKSSTSPS